VRWPWRRGPQARREAALREAAPGPLRDYLSVPFPDGDLPLAELPLLALDLETTGLDVRRDRVLSAGFVPVDGLRIDLAGARHLVVRDSGAQRNRSDGWLNERRWTLSHKATSIRAARMGLGYAWFPEENIREELDSGALRRLPLTEGSERFATLYLVYADRVAAGPGTRRLVEILREQVAENCRVAPTGARQ